MTDYYISPTGSGSADGSSAENAASIDSLNRLTTNASGGDRIILIADKGSYEISKSINLYAGGDAGNPITIIGQSSDGNEMNATFVSNRAEVYSPDAAQGAEIFRLNAGANNLVFENIDFKNVANAFRITGDVANITIQDVNATNISRLVEDLATGSNTSATVSGLTVRNVDVDGFAKGVIRLQYDSNNVLIENVNGDSQHIDGANFAIGIHIHGTAHDIIVRDTEMGNITDTVGGSYYNGDGFATEIGVYNVLFENTRAYNNTDSGYDIKSAATVLINAVADGNTRNFRFWADDTIAINLTGTNPTYHGGSSTNPSNVWVGSNGSVTISDSVFLDDDGLGYLFDLSEQNATLILDNVESSQLTTQSNGLKTILLSSLSSIIGQALPIAELKEISLSNSSVAENSKAGTIVGAFLATDAEGEPLEYALTDSGGGLFKLSGTNLVTAKAIDFEKNPSAAVTIMVTDTGGFSTTATFNVNILDVNEAPNTLTLSNATVAENALVGSTIGVFAAVDPEGEALTYSLTGKSAALFQINGNQLQLAKTVDYEAMRYAKITAEVTDAGGLTVTKNFNIGVIDVNEAPTKITLSKAVVAENSMIGKVVGSFGAIDPEKNALTYSLIDDADGIFKLNGNKLVLAGNVDYETLATHKIGVEVTDVGGLTLKQFFKIDIANVNEAPTSLTISNAIVAENSAIGTVVGELSAFDPEGKALRYVLTDTAGGLFRMDGANVVVAKNIDFEKVHSDTISVRVRDVGGLTSTKTFTIEVSDVNELDAIAPKSVAVGESVLKGSKLADHLSGGSGHETLYGRTANDVLKGGAGHDVLHGGAGADDLYGGRGRDVFLFTDLSDSRANRVGRDTIFDFSGKSGDRIDVSAIDANTTISGNQSFSFIDKAAFTGTAGEMRCEYDRSGGYVYADVDGDKVADFGIHFGSRATLIEDYFML